MGFIGVIVLALVGVLLLALMILTLIYLIVSYILQSLSVKKLFTFSGKKICVRAWIPFYHKYLLGKIANHKIIGVFSSLFTILLHLFFHIII